MLEPNKIYKKFDLYKLQEKNKMNLTCNRIIYHLNRQGIDIHVKEKFFIFTLTDRVFIVNDFTDNYFMPTHLAEISILTIQDGITKKDREEITHQHGVFTQFDFIQNLSKLTKYNRNLKCNIKDISLTNYITIKGVLPLSERRNKRVFN